MGGEVPEPRERVGAAAAAADAAGARRPRRRPPPCRRPGPGSARRAAKRRRRDPARTTPEAGSRGSCRRRSASARSRLRPAAARADDLALARAEAPVPERAPVLDLEVLDLRARRRPVDGVGAAAVPLEEAAVAAVARAAPVEGAALVLLRPGRPARRRRPAQRHVRPSPPSNAPGGGAGASSGAAAARAPRRRRAARARRRGPPAPPRRAGRARDDADIPDDDEWLCFDCEQKVHRCRANATQTTPTSYSARCPAAARCSAAPSSARGARCRRAPRTIAAPPSSRFPCDALLPDARLQEMRRGVRPAATFAGAGGRGVAAVAERLPRRRDRLRTRFVPAGRMRSTIPSCCPSHVQTERLRGIHSC